jgi:hypothetical protein
MAIIINVTPLRRTVRGIIYEITRLSFRHGRNPRFLLASVDRPIAITWSLLYGYNHGTLGFAGYREGAIYLRPAGKSHRSDFDVSLGPSPPLPPTPLLPACRLRTRRNARA